MDARIPLYLAELLAAQYGPALAEEIAAGFVPRRPVTLRINPLRTERGKVLAQLEAAGIAYEAVAWYADALLLPSVREEVVRALPCYAEGGIYLQSLSAMVPALLMDLPAGASVLDMCAAPGGKTAQMAALSGGAIQLTACERDAGRAERLRFNLERQGVRRATVMRTDARQLDDLFRFDSILLDAPCTGSGTLLLGESNPPRRMEPAWVQRTARTQAALLQKALRLLQPGGTLVYSTCSILSVENEEIVRPVLQNGLAQLEPVPADLAAALPTLPASLEGTLCIRPTDLYEGFFVAKLRKTAR